MVKNSIDLLWNDCRHFFQHCTFEIKTFLAFFTFLLLLKVMFCSLSVELFEHRYMGFKSRFLPHFTMQQIQRLYQIFSWAWGTPLRVFNCVDSIWPVGSMVNSFDVMTFHIRNGGDEIELYTLVRTIFFHPRTLLYDAVTWEGNVATLCGNTAGD